MHRSRRSLLQIAAGVAVVAASLIALFYALDRGVNANSGPGGLRVAETPTPLAALRDALASDGIGFTTIIGVTGFFTLFPGLHLLRRGLRAPWGERRASPRVAIAPSKQRHDLTARLSHWLGFLLFIVLAVSGVAVYSPGLLPRPIISWGFLHEIVAGLFAAGLVFHAVVACRRPTALSVWFARRDWSQLRVSVAYYLGVRSTLSWDGKYDAWQKLFHALLTVLSVVALITGVSLLISIENWATQGYRWLRWQRPVHELAAVLFLAAIVGHAYARLLATNRHTLYAMVTGYIKRKPV